RRSQVQLLTDCRLRWRWHPAGIDSAASKATRSAFAPLFRQMPIRDLRSMLEGREAQQRKEPTLGLCEGSLLVQSYTQERRENNAARNKNINTRRPLSHPRVWQRAFPCRQRC